MLKDLAKRHNKTVITSIHQPSSAVFRSFDMLLMLAYGCMVYHGTPHGSLQYLKEHGYECPPGYNIADHWIDSLEADGAGKSLIAAWDKKVSDNDFKCRGEGNEASIDDVEIAETTTKKYNPSWLTKFV
eukprot:15239918-Ditylum_brightwellii.AAC.1